MLSFINFLQRGLDGSSQRQRTLNNNVANVDTPNYKRRDVDFISALRKESKSSNKSSKLASTDSKHIPFKDSSSQFKRIQQNNSSARNDGNNVEIDREMAEIAKNNIYYNAMAQQLSDRFKLLNNVIDKGGR